MDLNYYYFTKVKGKCPPCHHANDATERKLILLMLLFIFKKKTLVNRISYFLLLNNY